MEPHYIKFEQCSFIGHYIKKNGDSTLFHIYVFISVLCQTQIEHLCSFKPE